MASLTAVVDNAIAFLKTRIPSETALTLASELQAVVGDLTNNPAHPIKPKIETLFKRYDIEPIVREKLLSSLTTAIVTERQKRYPVHDASKITSFDYELVGINKQLSLARVQDDIPQLQHLGPEKIVEIISGAALPLAKLLGVDVAKALVLTDPAGVINSKTSIARALRGASDLDPIAVTNLFTRLSGEQKAQFTRLIADRLTSSKQQYENANSGLIRDGKVKEYLSSLLIEHGIPQDFLAQVTELLLTNYRPQQLVNMSDPQLRSLLTKALHFVTT